MSAKEFGLIPKAWGGGGRTGVTEDISAGEGHLPVP